MPKKSGILLAVDVGSSSIKASLVQESGEIRASCRVPLSVKVNDDQAEMHVMDIWSSVVRSVQQLTQGEDVNRIKGIGITSQMAGLILLDDANQPLRPAILGVDQRGHVFVHELEKELGKKQIYERTGCPLIGIYPASKILWIYAHQPNLMQKARYVVGIKEFLLWKMTGKWCTDPATATTTQMYDQTTGKWWTEMLHVLGLSPDQLPQVKPPDELVGGVLPETAQALGLKAGTPVVVGTGDGPAANLSTGATTDRELCISLGTTAVTRFFTHTRYDIEENQHYFCQKFNEGSYLQGYRLDGAGMMINRYLHGNGKHSLSAVLDDIARQLYDSMHPFLSERHFRNIRPIGGGSSNEMWMQGFADLFKLPVILTHAKDSTLGAAVLIATALNIYGSIEQAGEEMVRIERVFNPRTC